MERKPYFLCLQICEAGKQTIPIPAGPVEDEGAAMGLLWPFQIKKFPRQPIFPTRTHNLKLIHTIWAVIILSTLNLLNGMQDAKFWMRNLRCHISELVWLITCIHIPHQSI